MTTTKKWTINDTGIKNSLKKVITTKNIDHLTKDAYNFTMNLSGFIAHYNIHGFKEEYQNVADLVRDLQNSTDILRPDYYITDRYFSEGDQKEYYQKKSEILRFIKNLVEDIEIKNEVQTFTYERAINSY